MISSIIEVWKAKLEITPPGLVVGWYTLSERKSVILTSSSARSNLLTDPVLSFCTVILAPARNLLTETMKN